MAPGRRTTFATAAAALLATAIAVDPVAEARAPAPPAFTEFDDSSGIFTVAVAGSHPVLAGNVHRVDVRWDAASLKPDVDRTRVEVTIRDFSCPDSYSAKESVDEFTDCSYRGRHRGHVLVDPASTAGVTGQQVVLDLTVPVVGLGQVPVDLTVTSATPDRTRVDVAEVADTDTRWRTTTSTASDLGVTGTVGPLTITGDPTGELDYLTSGGRLAWRTHTPLPWQAGRGAAAGSRWRSTGEVTATARVRFFKRGHWSGGPGNLHLGLLTIDRRNVDILDAVVSDVLSSATTHWRCPRPAKASLANPAKSGCRQLGDLEQSTVTAPTSQVRVGLASFHGSASPHPLRVAFAGAPTRSEPRDRAVTFSGRCTVDGRFPATGTMSRLDFGVLRVRSCSTLHGVTFGRAVPPGARLTAEGRYKVLVFDQYATGHPGNFHVLDLTWAPSQEPAYLATGLDVSGTVTDLSCPGQFYAGEALSRLDECTTVGTRTGTAVVDLDDVEIVDATSISFQLDLDVPGDDSMPVDMVIGRSPAVQAAEVAEQVTTDDGTTWTTTTTTTASEPPVNDFPDEDGTGVVAQELGSLDGVILESLYRSLPRENYATFHGSTPGSWSLHVPTSD